MAKKVKFKGDCSDAPSIKSYFELWGSHEFTIENQRNLLLWFLAEKGLDDRFVAFLDRWFPENTDGYRVSREELEAELKKMKGRLGKRG